MAPALPGIELKPLAGAVPAWRAEVDAGGWRAAAETAANAGARLAALWASDERDRGRGFAVNALLACYEGLVWLQICLQADPPAYPPPASLPPSPSPPSLVAEP